jgi:hypothetical protein
MPDFIVCLRSPSVIRLGTKPYDDEESRKTLFLSLPDAQVAVFDWLAEVTSEISVRDGLLIQVKLAASDIDSAIGISTNVAGYALSMLSCVTMASVDNPFPIWAYDATEGVVDREYRHCFYEGVGPIATRALNDQHLLHLLEKNYDSFLSRKDVKDDFKERVQRAMMAFRRGLADNDDILNEFLTAWSTMEGLDCVYTKLLPASTVRDFKDGMKDVLKRLGRPEAFDKLERLRNDIAHGSLSLAQAIQTAVDHAELIRRALVMMILRILKADETIIQEVISQAAYKGKARRHLRLMATIKFDPIDVQDPINQPRVRVWLEGERFTKNSQTLGYTPDLRCQPLNLKEMSARGLQFWGDAAAPIRMNDIGVRVITGDGSQS